MSRIAISLAALLAALCVNSLAIAHPGHSHEQLADESPDSDSPHERTWSAASGDFRLHGSFVAVRDGQVQIRRSDESLVSVKLSQLSEADQQWVAGRLARIRQANEALAPVSKSLSENRLGERDSPILLRAVSFNDGRKIGTVPDGSRIVSKPIVIPVGGADDVEERPGRDLLAAQELPLLLAQADTKGAQTDGAGMPEIAKAFAAFVKLQAIKTRWDDRYFYVESNGVPAHRLMVGVTAWQQQVPIPQKYFGDNAWRIPLHPAPAKNPQSTKGNFLRGAIALAANGVPIFNPLNNRGDDAYLFGELDEFGGHCGRADDYHYHLAPVHLEKTVGRGLPIAYALDGYPIYGYAEPDGSPVKQLDEWNGHKDAGGDYHYHATKKYPYLNGGFYGEVTERDGQVDPQPRAAPLRPAQRPLRDAKITDFVETKPGSYRLTYDVRGKTGTVSYTLAEDGSARFTFVDTDGKTTSETYAPERRGPGDRERRPPPPAGDDRPPPRDNAPPPRDDRGPPPRKEERVSKDVRSGAPRLDVTSSALDAQGNLPPEFTCDGAKASPPVEWKNAPPGTKAFALSLWHTAPDQEKSYWVIYNIPANVTEVAKNAKNVGTMGLNDRRRPEYDPMCSKGPGVKKYHITVYALSAEPKLSPDKATRANLLAAIKDITLAEGTLDFFYERKR